MSGPAVQRMLILICHDHDESAAISCRTTSTQETLRGSVRHLFGVSSDPMQLGKAPRPDAGGSQVRPAQPHVSSRDGEGPALSTLAAAVPLPLSTADRLVAPECPIVHDPATWVSFSLPAVLDPAKAPAVSRYHLRPAPPPPPKRSWCQCSPRCVSSSLVRSRSTQIPSLPWLPELHRRRRLFPRALQRA